MSGEHQGMSGEQGQGKVRLRLTLKFCRPPAPPTTFKHEGWVQQNNSKSKKVSEWSPYLSVSVKKN